MPRGLVLKRPGEPRPVTRPRHRADHDAVTSAGHPRCVGLNVGKRRPEIQRAPAPPPVFEIKARTAAPADTAAITLSPVRPDSDHELSLAAAVDVLDDRPLQPQQPGPYPCSVHVASSSSRFRSSSSQNPRRRAACALFKRSPQPTETSGAPENSGGETEEYNFVPHDGRVPTRRFYLVAI